MPQYITDPELLAQLEGPAKTPAARTPQEFAKAYGPVAERAGKALGVDPSILIGQWGLETGWGKSVIPGTNNLGNIKDFAGGGVAATDNMTGSRDKYRAYESPDAFADDFVSLVQRKYPNAVGAKDPMAFATALKDGGYAEDPRYADKVVQATRMAGTKQNPVMQAVGRAVEAVVPSAQAAQPAQRQYIQDPTLLAELDADDTAGVPRVEVTGTNADVAPLSRTDRVVQGALDPISGGAQLLTRALPTGVVQAGNRLNNWLADKTGLVGRIPEGGVDQMVRDQEAEYEARRRASAGGEDPGFDGYRLLGNVVSPANLAIAARAPQAATALGRVASAATAAGASGALAPVATGDPENFASDKLKQIGTSAAFGGALQPVAAGVGRLISPNASTNPLLQRLQQEGVRPTVGQALGGWANNLEQRLTSIPVLGDAISGARRAAQDDLRRAAQNRVSDPIRAPRVAETGTDGVAAISRQVDDAYDAARGAMGAFRVDQQGAQELQTVRQMIGALDPKEQRQFSAVWGELQQDIRNGVIDSAVFKRIDSKLGQEAAKFRGAQDPYQQQLGDAFAEMQRVIRGAGARANPQAAALFQQADEAFANLVRVQNAAGRAAAQDGAFTPGQLTQAVRASDQSARRNATAQGDALMQDLSSAGNTLSNTVPDSGTAGRTFAGIAALASGAINPLLPLAIGGSSLLYTQPAQSALRALATARPQSAQAVRNALLQASPRLAPAAGQVGLQALE